MGCDPFRSTLSQWLLPKTTGKHRYLLYYSQQHQNYPLYNNNVTAEGHYNMRNCSEVKALERLRTTALEIIFFLLLLFCFCVVLGVVPKTLDTMSKWSTAEPSLSQPLHWCIRSKLSLFLLPFIVPKCYNPTASAFYFDSGSHRQALNSIVPISDSERHEPLDLVTPHFILGDKRENTIVCWDGTLKWSWVTSKHFSWQFEKSKLLKKPKVLYVKTTSWQASRKAAEVSRNKQGT